MDGVDKLKVVATITNTGSEVVKLLDDPRSLASRRPVNKFSILSSKGGRPSFTGIRVKYSPEVAAKMGAYTELAPGASLKVIHDRTSQFVLRKERRDSHNLHSVRGVQLYCLRTRCIRLCTRFQVLRRRRGGQSRNRSSRNTQDLYHPSRRAHSCSRPP